MVIGGAGNKTAKREVALRVNTRSSAREKVSESQILGLADRRARNNGAWQGCGALNRPLPKRTARSDGAAAAKQKPDE